MYTYYIADDEDRIVLYDRVKANLEVMQEVMPQYADYKITRTSKTIVSYKGAFYFDDDEEYLAMVAADEQAYIQALYMTRSDFFDGTIKAWGAGEDELYVVINTILTTLSIPELQKKIALNNYSNALNFYRKHTLFTLLSNVPIPLGEGITVIITPEQWDLFFEETAKRNPNAYMALLPPQAGE